MIVADGFCVLPVLFVQRGFQQLSLNLGGCGDESFVDLQADLSVILVYTEEITEMGDLDLKFWSTQIFRSNDLSGLRMKFIQGVQMSQ